MGYLKKRQLQAASGGAPEVNVKKISLVILREGEIDTRGENPTPKYIPGRFSLNFFGFEPLKLHVPLWVT